MTIIKPNSIAGITSITAQGDVINVYKSDGTAAGLQLNGVNFNTTSGVSTFNNLTVGAALSLTDNVKAQFGTDGDLQIYHDGTKSVIEDVGTGSLFIKATDLVIRSAANEDYLDCSANGAVRLYHDNSVKLATTSTGIDVTGSVTCDGLTVDGALTQSSGAGLISIKDNNSTGSAAVSVVKGLDSADSEKWSVGQISTGNENLYIRNVSNAPIIFETNDTNRVVIDSAGHLHPEVDSTYDIGLTGTRWRNVYADTLYGDGSNLTGIGVGIQSAGNLIGYGVTTLNFIGAGNTFAINGSTVDISIAGGGGGGGSSDGSDFNTGITSSITALPVGVGTTVLTLPSTAGKQYLVSSILASNVAAGNTEVNIIGAFDFTSGYGGGERSYFAYNIPIPTGTALELLEESQILNPNDRITVRSTDVNRNGVDNAVELFITYEEKTSSDYFGIGISTVGLAVTSAIGIFTSTTYPSIVQSIRVVNRTDDGDYPISVDVTSGVTTIRIVDNLIVPKYGSVELLSKEKRLYIGDEIKVQVDQISTIDVQVSGKKITS